MGEKSSDPSADSNQADSVPGCSLTQPSPSQLMANNPQAWERFVRLYGKLVYHWCRRGGVPREDAADVCQDVFVKVARGIRSFHSSGPETNYCGWLREITRSRIADYWRANARRVGATGG